MATKRERQRKLAKEAHERRRQRQAERDRKTKRTSAAIIVALLVVAVGVGSAVLAGAFSSSPSKAAASSTPSSTPTPTPTPTASASPSASALPAMVNGKCIYTSSGTAARKVKLPPSKPDTKASYQATIATNRGNIVIDLQNSDAPCTVNSFVSLADQDFFNNTHCLRLTTAASGYYVLQCGDPSGTGEGGPGYEFANENTTGGFESHLNSSGYATYPTGTLAMANSGGTDTNGSQFFLVYKNSAFPPDYTPFGTIVSGLNIIQNVAKAGSDNSNGQGDGHPKEKVEINSVTIKKT